MLEINPGITHNVNPLNNDSIPPIKPNMTDYQIIKIKQERLAVEYRQVYNDKGFSKQADLKISELERQLLGLEDLLKDLESIGPNATIEDVKRKKAEEAHKIQNGTAFGKPKTLSLSNPNVPKGLAEEAVHPKPRFKDDGFFRGFIYTALTCSLLMGAYMFWLF